MTSNQARLMTKREIADLLGVSVDDICKWAQPFAFADWLAVCATRKDRTHDEDDILIVTLISELDSQIEDNVPFNQRIRRIKDKLRSLPRAASIGQKRKMEKTSPQVARWQVASSMGACLRYEYEWLKPLRSCVDSIVDFGCWATGNGTCSEPYALLWTLEATRIVVIDKEPEHIRNAQEWLENVRKRHPYFEDYNLEFMAGDMTEEMDALDEGAFDLSYCKDVLYNMHPNSKELQDSINMMARVVKPDGWVIAVEQKMGREHERAPSNIPGLEVCRPIPESRPVDISHLFEAARLDRVSLDSAPDWSYCYKKPSG